MTVCQIRACLGCLLTALSVRAATPYTHQNFLDDPEEFHFAVIANLRLDGIFAGNYLDQSNSKTTYVTKAYDDPVDPEVAKRLEKLDRRRQELFYRWDERTFDRWTAPGGGVPGRLVTFEINGTRSGTWMRADDKPAGRFPRDLHL